VTRRPQAERRAAERLAAARFPDGVTLQLHGGEALTVLDFCTAGILAECGRRLVPGQRCWVRQTSSAGTARLSGRVLRSRLVRVGQDGTLVYRAAIRLDEGAVWAATTHAGQHLPSRGTPVRADVGNAHPSRSGRTPTDFDLQPDPRARS